MRPQPRRPFLVLLLFSALLSALLGVFPGPGSHISATAPPPPPATPTPPPSAPFEMLPPSYGQTIAPLPGYGSPAPTSPGGVLLGPLTPSGTPCDIHCISHIVILSLENESADRLLTSITNTAGMTIAGIPLVNGTPAAYTCLPDPRQPTVVLTPGQATPTPWPCLAPYDIPYVPGATPTVTPHGYYGPEDQYDNPHDFSDSSVDVQGIAPSLHYRPGTVATPMTGFLERAWLECQLPMTQTYGYNTHNPACLGPTEIPGPGTPTATWTPLGAATATPPPFDVMRYMTPQDIPIYLAYAQYYTVQDNLFAPVNSYSLPSHLYLLSNWSATCPISGTPQPPTATPPPPLTPTATPDACYSAPATPQAIVDLPGYAPAGQPWPQYAWTDITYLLDHHQLLEQGGVPVATTTSTAGFCGTDTQGHSVYFNPLETPLPTPTGAACQPAPVSWKYYVGGGTQLDCPTPVPTPTGGAGCNPNQQLISGTVEYWNPLQFFTTVNADGTPSPGQPTPTPGGPPGQTGNIQFYKQFYDDVVSGTLPAVSWIMPEIVLSDHAPNGLTYSTYPYDGQYLLAWVIWVLQNQGAAYGHEDQWDHTAVFVTWDDWGGFYDHVQPPPTPTPPASGLNADWGYGIRVPGLVISPLANHCSVDHQLLSFDAYNRFIEDDFLGSQRLDGQVDGRPDGRPDVRETALPSDLSLDFNWSRTSFDDNSVPMGTPTPLAYGQTYAIPPPSWCSS